MPVLDIGAVTFSVDGSSEVAIGAEHFDGRVSRFAIGKPSDAAASAAEFVSSTYNSGSGIVYGQVTATQITNWGLATWSNLGEASGTAAESHASKTLVDVNTVTSADGPEAAAQGPAVDLDPVIQLLSKEGGALVFAQPTTAKRPIQRTGANGINSQHALQFNGSNSLLVLGSAPLQGEASITLFLPFQTGASAFAADQVIFSSSDEATATTYWCAAIDSAGKFYVEVNNAGTVYRATGGTVLSVSTDYLVTIRDTGSAIEIEIGGISETIAETGTYEGISNLTGLDNTVIGALKHTSEVDHFEGLIPEQILFSPKVSASGEAATERSTNSRYGT